MIHMTNQKTKYRLFENVTGDTVLMEEVLDYTNNKFVSNNTTVAGFLESVPLPDEAYVNTWIKYQKKANEIGLFETLQHYLVQFQFPIQKNISQSYDYRAAMLKGRSTNGMVAATGLILNDKDALELHMYQSVAGKIPVLIVSNDDDFCDIVRALSLKNEPGRIPKSMGAAMIKGINNWDRIETLKKNWLERNPKGNWSKEFMANILPTKSLYQDKIIVLSHKPYSGVTPESLGISQNKWIESSLKIRLEHECAHFFTLRYYGHMANNMHDELLADYMGISKVLGKFNADWFLKFIGLENYPKYRSGARLENYLGTSQLSKEGFNLLKTIVKLAAHNVAEFDEYLGPHQNQIDRTARLMSLCSLDLLKISSEHGVEKLITQYKNFVNTNSLNIPQYEE